LPRGRVIAGSRPTSSKPLLVETFGSPFSPLNDAELQIELIRALAMPCVLVTASAVGAIGRSLQCLQALASYRIVPLGVALVGPADPFAEEQIGRHWRDGHIWSLAPPAEWNDVGIKGAANKARATLTAIRTLLANAESKCSMVHAAHERNAANTAAQTPAHRQVVERDRLAVWHPYTALGDGDDPQVCTGAEGEFLHLADGRQIVDAISSWWTILHGHRHPVLMSALEQASRRFDHVHFAGITHEPAVELAELMLQTTPWPAGRVFFSDNGSTAVEVALKMAYQYWCHHNQPQRHRFVAFEHGYHGDTFGSMAVGRDPLFFGRFEPLLFDASILPLSAQSLDAELSRRAGETAAVIIEPLVQGAGGMRMHSVQELRELAEVARKHNVLFIADEVMTGGRTGTQWAHAAAGIVPDLICTGKTLAGGVLPLAATLAAPRIVEAFQSSDRTRTFFHGHSFTAHPLACAVACANWKMLMPDAASAAKKLETFWRARLAPMRSAPPVRDVRVRGSIAAVELDAAGGYLAEVGRQLRMKCLELGVLVRPLGNVIYAMPPLQTSAESLQRIADALEAAVASVEQIR
jgi:adenosylmethionine-8-amino-7-oxononanoate aminotransferase